MSRTPDQYRRWRAAGLCTSCGRERAPGDQRLCAVHRAQADGYNPGRRVRATACRVCGAPLSGRRLSLCSERCRRSTLNVTEPEHEPCLPECMVCYDQPWRRGDVEDRTADGSWRRTGDVCPGCGLVRELQTEDLIMVAMASSAGFWSAAIPEAAE